MGFSLDSWYLLPLLALLPFIYRKTKEKIASAPVTTISLARYRLLASLMQQRKTATGPAKVPLLLFVAAALAIVAASQPTPSVPAPGHGVAVVVGVQASDSMNFPMSDNSGRLKLKVVSDAAKEIFRALGPGDLSAILVHDARVAFSSKLGQSTSASLETLGSLVTGLGGNSPGPAAVHAMQLLAPLSASTPRRVVVLINDGAGINENVATMVAKIQELQLPPVEGYLVSIGSVKERQALEPYAAALGWTVVDSATWSAERVASGPPGGSGEMLVPMAPILALAAFALIALTVFKASRLG